VTHFAVDSNTVRDELSYWFFDRYLPAWVGVGNGTSDLHPEFILEYWGVPMHHCMPNLSVWLMDAAAVVDFLKRRHRDLRAMGYSYTAVPDRKLIVYHSRGAAIEVIWSRCRADGSEIERLAVHFEIARELGGWRIVAIQAAPTHADTLQAAWPNGQETVHNGSEIQS
jgi:hypothetical protein